MKNTWMIKRSGLIPAAVLLLLASACFEEGDPPEFTLFAAEYNTNFPPGADPAAVEELVANGDAQVTGSAESFIPEVTDHEELNNQIELFGDLSTTNSNILVTMNRAPHSDAGYPRAIVMEIVGPFSINQATTTGYGQIWLGEDTPEDMPFTTQGNPNTYFKFTVTELDTENKRIEGTFEFLAKREGAAFSVVVFDGSFNWHY